MRHLTKIKIKQILDLFYFSNDKRIKTIAKITGFSEPTVSKTVDSQLKKKKYDKQKFIIYHSKINYHD